MRADYLSGSDVKRIKGDVFKAAVTFRAKETSLRICLFCSIPNNLRCNFSVQSPFEKKRHFNRIVFSSGSVRHFTAVLLPCSEANFYLT